jgi:nitroreductase
MLKAALRVPDHAWLRPSRFLTIKGLHREALGQLFVAGAQQRRVDNNEPALELPEIDKVAAKALRSPLIIAVVASIKEHPKVPAVEQLISSGCAAHAILLAAHAHGFAGVWRTGANAYDATVKKGLGLQAHEELVGFLYLGSIEGSYKPLRALSVDDFCQTWQGEPE